MALTDRRPPKKQGFDWGALFVVLGVCWLGYMIATNPSRNTISDCEAENIRAINEQAGRLKDSGQRQAGDNLKSSARRIAKSRC